MANDHLADRVKNRLWNDHVGVEIGLHVCHEHVLDVEAKVEVENLPFFDNIELMIIFELSKNVSE